LVDQIRSKNFMFGRTAAPVLELSSAPFNTQFGMQKRGDFKVQGRWVDLGGNQALSGPALKQLPEPTLAEELNDEIPDFATEDTPPFDIEANSTPAAQPEPKRKVRF
jgi:hypothetical protein